MIKELENNNFIFQKKSTMLANHIYIKFSNNLLSFWEGFINLILSQKELRLYLKKSQLELTMEDKIKIKNILHKNFKDKKNIEMQEKLKFEIIKHIEQDKNYLYKLYIQQRLNIYNNITSEGINFKWIESKGERQELIHIINQEGFEVSQKIDMILREIREKILGLLMIKIERAIGLAEINSMIYRGVGNIIEKGKKDFYEFISDIYLRVGNLANKHLSKIKRKIRKGKPHA